MPKTKAQPTRKGPPKDNMSSEIESFLKKEFPLKEEESMVKYCPVGDLAYRINFYKNVAEEGKWLPNFIIVRSLYVLLKKDKTRFVVHKQW